MTNRIIYNGNTMTDQTEKPWKGNVAVFLVSQVVSLLGSALVQYAIMWHITLETKSGIMMTLYIICGFVPTFLLSPFAGVWADRYNRKKLIILADGMIAGVTLAMALVFMAGFRSVPLLFLVSAVRSVGTAVQGPAVGAILPQMVPQDKLTRINGINGSIQSGIMFVAPIVSGALLTLTAIETIFFIDVVTAAAAIGLLLFFLKVGPHAKAAEGSGTGYFHDMLEGFRYIRNHRYLLSFFLYVGVFFFFITPAAFLTPLQTTRSFGSDVWRLTAIELVFSVGMMAGGAIIAAWGGFKNRMHSMVVSNIIMALCTIGLGLAPYFWLYLGFMGIFGLALPLYNTPSMVMIQEHVEENFMGRVFSVLSMLSTSLMPLGMLVFGPLADMVKIEWLLLATGGVMLLHGLRVLGIRRLIEAGKPVIAAAPAVPAPASID